jgi:hypothetical protein
MRSRIALHLVDPDAHRPQSPDGDAHVLALLEQLCGRDPRAWSRELSALYYAQEASSEALALALADRLWLRPRVLLSPRLPAAHWAGALDQLGRQQAVGTAIVVAPHAVTAPAVTALLQLERALDPSEHEPGVRRLVLLDEPVAENRGIDPELVDLAVLHSSSL